jgi:hypothetical protein
MVQDGIFDEAWWQIKGRIVLQSLPSMITTFSSHIKEAV